MKQLQFNKVQKGILFIMALFVAFMVVYPPTYYWGFSADGERVAIYSGYRFIGDIELTITSGNKYARSIVHYGSDTWGSIYHIEFVRLSFQLIGALITTILLIGAFSNDDNYPRESI